MAFSTVQLAVSARVVTYGVVVLGSEGVELGHRLAQHNRSYAIVTDLGGFPCSSDGCDEDMIRGKCRLVRSPHGWLKEDVRLRAGNCHIVPRPPSLRLRPRKSDWRWIH
jgi:hypothetical protein